MDGLRQYIVSIIIAALICGIIDGFSCGKTGSTLKLITGLFLTLTIFRPIFQINDLDFSDMIVSYTREADDSISFGEQAAQNAAGQIITEHVRAYILDKAQSLGLEISVEVFLEDEAPFLPDRISIVGSVSPQDKRRLETYISETLGIPKENQQWTGQIPAATS